MQTDIMYSLRINLESYMPELTEAQIIYDGVSISDIEKPFASIQTLLDQPRAVSAGMETFEETYFFQIGLYTTSEFKRGRLSEKVKTVLRRPDGVPFYRYNDVSEAFEDSGDRLLLTVDNFTPMTNSDKTSTTYNHHGYFDVSVTLYRKTGESDYTQ